MEEPTAYVFFNPKRWGEGEKFAYLHSSTYVFPKHIGNCVSGTLAYMRRAATLRELAKSLSSHMDEDKVELENKGYTKGTRSAQVAAVVEASITSLYSSVDTARKVVTHIYTRYRGLPHSTRKMFQAAQDDKIDIRVPEEIRLAFKEAIWYPKFRSLRDALTHLGAGSCHFDRNTKVVVYFHDGLGDGNKALCIPDIFKELDTYIEEVNKFLGRIFKALNETLSNDEVYQMCGVFNFRVYMRYVRPKEAFDFNSGRCDSYTWFEQSDNPRCPFTETCGAYLNKNRIGDEEKI